MDSEPGRPACLFILATSGEGSGGLDDGIHEEREGTEVCQNDSRRPCRPFGLLADVTLIVLLHEVLLIVSGCFAVVSPDVPDLR